MDESKNCLESHFSLPDNRGVLSPAESFELVVIRMVVVSLVRERVGAG
jgi:hypothetical protein